MNFLKQAFLHPRITGAIAPSSKQLTNLMLAEARLDADQVVVELGPGTGVFTERILAELPISSQYLGIEVNQDFATYLKKLYPEANIHHGAAQDIDLFLEASSEVHCDRIISGLPWADFHIDRQLGLLDKLHKSLSSNGLFLTFSYFPLHLLPRGRAFRTALEETFSSVQRSKIVFWNLPPAFVYVCRK